jgi:uncharacterized protein
MRRIFRIATITALASIAAMTLMLVSCQHKLIYFPRPYPAKHLAEWQQETPGKILSFSTSEGKQQAYLFRSRNQSAPQRLWVVCGGNGTLATDWTKFMKEKAPAEDAYLLIDYPGYGANQGSPHPKNIRETLKTAVPLAATELNWDATMLKERSRIFGHSLGCACALIAADEFSLNRGVLLSPFTSTMDMTKEVIGLPLGFLVIHRFDNKKILQSLASDPQTKIHLFHGLSDNVIPADMSRTLHSLSPEKLPLNLCEGSSHGDLQDDQAPAIISAMRAVR